MIKEVLDAGQSFDAIIDQTEDELIRLAASHGIPEASIDTPLNFSILQYLYAYYCREVFFALAGTSGAEIVLDDKYMVKYKEYLKRANELRDNITKEMFTNTADMAREFVTSQINLFRG